MAKQNQGRGNKDKDATKTTTPSAAPAVALGVGQSSDQALPNGVLGESVGTPPSDDNKSEPVSPTPVEGQPGEQAAPGDVKNVEDMEFLQRVITLEEENKNLKALLNKETSTEGEVSTETVAVNYGLHDEHVVVDRAAFTELVKSLTHNYTIAWTGQETARGVQRLLRLESYGEAKELLSAILQEK